MTLHKKAEAAIRKELMQFSKRSPNGCLEWQRRKTTSGYGEFRRLDERVAHRVAYKVFIGAVSDSLDVCHSCDNRICIEPKHLFAATRRENMRDCKVKGRFVYNTENLHKANWVRHLEAIARGSTFACKKEAKWK